MVVCISKDPSQTIADFLKLERIYDNIKPKNRHLSAEEKNLRKRLYIPSRKLGVVYNVFGAINVSRVSILTGTCDTLHEISLYLH